MTTRTLPAAVAGRSSAMRRQRRRVATAGRPTDHQLCRTNGCATFLVEQPDGGLRCPICQWAPHLH